MSSWYQRIRAAFDTRAHKAPFAVLVVDDEAPIRDMVASALEITGRPVRQAANSKQAISILTKERDFIGLALVDVVMPDEDGLSLAHRLREINPHLAIVMLSGQLNVESRWIVSEEGFRFVAKPFTIQELCDVVIEAVGVLRPGEGNKPPA